MKELLKEWNRLAFGNNFENQKIKLLEYAQKTYDDGAPLVNKTDWKKIHKGTVASKIWEYVIASQCALEGCNITVSGDTINVVHSTNLEGDTKSVEFVLDPIINQMYEGGAKGLIEMMESMLLDNSIQMKGAVSVMQTSSTAHSDILIFDRDNKLIGELHAKWNEEEGGRAIGTSGPNKNQGVGEYIQDEEEQATYVEDLMGFEELTTAKQSEGNPSVRAGVGINLKGNVRANTAFETGEDVRDEYIRILNTADGRKALENYLKSRFGREGTETWLVKGFHQHSKAADPECKWTKWPAGSSGLIGQVQLEPRAEKGIDLVHPRFGVLANLQVRSREGTHEPGTSGWRGRTTQVTAIENLADASEFTKHMKNAHAAGDNNRVKEDELSAAMDSILALIERDPSKEKVLFNKYLELQNLQDELFESNNKSKSALRKSKRYSITSKLFRE